MDQQQTPAEVAEVSFTADEIAGIEAAIEDARINGTIPYEEVLAWLDSLDTDNPLPEPQPRHD